MKLDPIEIYRAGLLADGIREASIASYHAPSNELQYGNVFHKFERLAEQLGYDVTRRLEVAS